MTYLTAEEWALVEESLKGKFNLNNLNFLLDQRVILNYDKIHFMVKEIVDQVNNSKGNIYLTTMILVHKYLIYHLLISGKETFLHLTLEDKAIICAASTIITLKINNFFCLTSKMATKIVVKILKDTYNKIKEDAQSKKISFNEPKINQKEISQKLANAEVDILTTLNFDINLDFPFDLLRRIKEYLCNYYSNNSVNAEQSFKLILNSLGDCYVLPSILYFNPNTILLACLSNLNKQYKLNYPIEDFLNLSEYPIRLEEINHCSRIISLILTPYQTNRNCTQNNMSIEQNKNSQSF